MARILLKGGIVVTGDSAIGDFDQGDVLIEDDKIIAVDRAIEVEDAERIDVSRMMVIPGLVQAHYHTWQTGIRNFGSNWTTPQYFSKMHGNIATKFAADDIYYGTLIGALDQINCGSTTLFEWCHNNPTPEHSDRSIDALQESGIRAVFAHGTPKPDPKPGQKHFSEIPQDRNEIARIRKGRLSSDDALVTMALAILGPDFGIDEVFHEDLKIAREFDLVTSAHVWNAPWRIAPEGYETVLKAGLIGPKHNIVHAVYSSEEEIKGICDAGGSFTATTVCELMGNRLHAIDRFEKYGVKPSLGADNQTKVAGDMFSVMRHALQSQRVLDIDHNPDRTADTPPRPSREAFEWATIEGAKMMGMESKIGSLTPGKQADIVLLDAYDLAVFPVHDPINAIVYYCDRSSVDSVMIAGNWLKRDGVLTYPNAKIRQKQEVMLDRLRDLMSKADYIHEVA